MKRMKGRTTWIGMFKGTFIGAAVMLPVTPAAGAAGTTLVDPQVAGDLSSPALPSGTSDEFRKQMFDWVGPQLAAPIRAKERAGSQSADLRRLAISSPFGWRSDPIKGVRRIHAGIDLPGPSGARVFATGAGIVRIAGWAGGYGNLVEIEHIDGVRTRYGHLARIDVSPAQYVGQGQLIGAMGSTGRSTGVHLHYEVRIGGKAIDPLRFIGQTSAIYETVWAGETIVQPRRVGWLDARSGDRLPQAVIH